MSVVWSPRLAGALAVVLAVPSASPAADAGRATLHVSREGAGAAGVEVALMAANLGKVSLGTTNGQGDVSFALSAANLGKAKVETVTEECATRRRVWLLGPGGELPPAEQGCRRRRAGFFLWGDDSRVSFPSVAAGNPYFKPAVGLMAGGAALTLFGLVSKKNICGGENLGPSCNETRKGVLVVGVAALAGGAVLWKLGQGKAAAELAPVPGGIALQGRVKF